LVLGVLLGSALALSAPAGGIAAPTRAAGGTAGPSAPAETQAAPTRPTAKSGPADQVTFQSARLRATITSGDQSTAYFFMYGPSVAYGSQSLPVTLEGDDHADTVFSQISGLLPQTVYHYRVVAINALGTSFGADETFTTAPAPLSLVISASANPVLTGTPVSIVGAITGTDAGGSVVVLQQDPFPFSGGFQVVGGPGVASASGSFSFETGPIATATEFRVVGVGPGEPLVSDTLTEFAQVAVTMDVTRTGAKGTTFAGVIAPAEDGARVSVQRLVGGRWMLVAASTARAAAAGSSSYAITLHLVHSGSYRVFAASVEGGHLENESPPETIHAHGSLPPAGV
jgi:hypothetical protein